MRPYIQSTNRFDSGRSVRRFSRSESVRALRVRRARNSAPSGPAGLRKFGRGGGRNSVRLDAKPPLRVFALDVARKVVALTALVGGIIAVTRWPELLLPLLPLEALIACDLVLRDDRAHRRQNQCDRQENPPAKT